MSTDEAQNIWVATPAAIYVMKPGDTMFTRYSSRDGLHLSDNLLRYCDSWAKVDRTCPSWGGATSQGIAEITGGGPGEVFVGYWGQDYGDTSYQDPPSANGVDPAYTRHTGKLDRVRLQADGSLQVTFLDMVSGNSAEFWHNRTVHRLIFDHFVHAHELYVGTNHGVDRLLPDNYRAPQPGEWFNKVNREWMSDHLHPEVCYHAPCPIGKEGDLRIGEWRGLALTPDGNLWVGGRWAAGEIRWAQDTIEWFYGCKWGDGDQPAPCPASAPNYNAPYLHGFGDPYNGPDAGGNAPVFRPPQEGDPVSISGVSVATDGHVWFTSGPWYNNPLDIAYGVATWKDHEGFTYYSPSQLGIPEQSVRDVLALPDGRILFATWSSGLTLHDPATNTSQQLTAPQYLPSNRVRRLELDTMVSPWVVHVATSAGGASLRVLP